MNPPLVTSYVYYYFFLFRLVCAKAFFLSSPSTKNLNRRGVSRLKTYAVFTESPFLFASEDDSLMDGSDHQARAAVQLRRAPYQIYRTSARARLASITSYVMRDYTLLLYCTVFALSCDPVSLESTK